jgi:hypothetical protein
MSKRKMITLPTSAKHAILLDTAMKRATPGTTRHDMLVRLGRSLDTYGGLTSAMQETCRLTILSTA